MTGHDLKALRDSTGLSQEKFGVFVIGVTGPTICRWECAARPIDDLKAGGIEARVALYVAGENKS